MRHLVRYKFVLLTARLQIPQRCIMQLTISGLRYILRTIQSIVIG